MGISFRGKQGLWGYTGIIRENRGYDMDYCGMLKHTEEGAVKGLCIGLGIGAALGCAVLGSLCIGVCMGISLGTAAGALIGLYRDYRDTGKDLRGNNT